MSLTDLPIPPKPDVFSPEGAPPGVAVDLEAYRSHIYADRAWYLERPHITPRVAVVHTNGAYNEGSLASSIYWGNRDKNNTKPHYAVNAPQPTKLVPTDRRAIGNSTPSSMEAEYGVPDSSFWSIVIETADRGTKYGSVDLGDFLYDHAEIVSRILAYESIVWDFPLEIPDSWIGEGVVTHTAPWDGVYTIYKGKSCPGTTKKQRVLYGDILPRARQIRDAWTGVSAEDPYNPLEDPEMYCMWKMAGSKELFLVGPGGAALIGRDYRDGVAVPKGVKRFDVPADEQGKLLYKSYCAQAAVTKPSVEA